MHKLLAGSLPRLERDLVLEAEYAEAKTRRALHSLDDLGHWPDGLAERFTRRVGLIRGWADRPDGSLWASFDLSLVSSWVDGSGVDEHTKVEEPEFWAMKTAHKTWGGRFPDHMKLSDFDLNLFTVLGAPVDVNGLWDLDDSGTRVRVDMYPYKGERGIGLWS